MTTRQMIEVFSSNQAQTQEYDRIRKTFLETYSA